jgi:centromere protein C
MAGAAMSEASDSDSELAGSAPEPTEVLSTRRVTLKSSKTTFPPALGRSPYKTNIGSSPRRQSSVKPRRTVSDTPELLEPRPTVTRRLDFTVNGDVTSGDERSSRSTGKRKSAVPPKKDIYALEVTEEEDEGRFTEEPELPMPDESLQLLQDVEYDDGAEFEEPLSVVQTSSPTRQRRSQFSARRFATSNMEEEEEEEDVEIVPVEPTIKKKGKTPARKSLTGGDTSVKKGKAVQKTAPRRGGKAALRSTKQPQAVEESTISVDESTIEPSFEESLPQKPAAKGRGKGRSRQLHTPEDNQPTPDEPVETTELEDSVVEQPVKKRGRPGPKRKLSMHEDTEVDPEEASEILDPQEATEIERPTKRTKAAPKKVGAKKASKGPKERDPNIMGPPVFKKPDLPLKAGAGARWDESMWANSRNMSRLRDPTPSAEAMVGRTRSGRQVIKPLNHFANERAQYSRDGTLLAVQTAETVEKDAPQRSRNGAASRAPATSRRAASRRRQAEETIMEEEEDGEDEELEDWEAKGEMIYGEVNGYDALTGFQTDKQFETGIFPSPLSTSLFPLHRTPTNHKPII